MFTTLSDTVKIFWRNEDTGAPGRISCPAFPPDDEPGVDNVLGPVLAEGEEMFMIRAALDNNVASGLILLMLEVRGVDDFTNDDRVEVDVLFGVLPSGVTMPMLEGDGGFVPGQTFDVDSRSLLDDRMTARVSLPGMIIDGRVHAGPGGLNLTVPFGVDTITPSDVRT